ncbi:restriction endonuclease subunit S [Methanosarcina sp.]|uniref:restriction endonuclease subunit S n=1 Tax=Methanosarcina sp. TaxID=2213 RepID=UPI003BB7C4F0
MSPVSLWPRLPLSEAFWFQEGPGVRKWQFTKSGIKLLNVGNIEKNGTLNLAKTERYLDEAEVAKKYSHFLVDEGDLVIASSGISFDDDGLLRTRGTFIKSSHLPLCLNTSTIRFKAEEGTSDLHFLRFWLNSYEFRSQITKLVTGSAQQNFGPSHLKALKITLPPLEKQKRIADILERAEALRAKRRAALAQLDELIQSIFIEMFGDPVKNPSDLKIVSLEDACSEIYRYPTFYGLEYVEEGVPIVRIGNILSDGSLDPNKSNYVFIDPSISKRFPRTILELDDILMAVRGDGSTAKRIGMVSNLNIVGANISPNLIRIKANRDVVNPIYLFYFLTSEYGQSVLQQSVTRTAKKTITAENIKKVFLLHPSIKDQNKFAEIVDRVEQIKKSQQQSLLEISSLFDSLMYEAFTGKLFSPQSLSEK